MSDYAAIEKEARIFTEECVTNNRIDPTLFAQYDIKRGLRDKNGKGVLAGITNISRIDAFEERDGQKVPCEGKLWYRGYNVYDLIRGLRGKRYAFEGAAYLLLLGDLPNKEQLESFTACLAKCRDLPTNFVRDVIMKAPSHDLMNSLTRSVLTLASYDDDIGKTDLQTQLEQCIKLISVFPMLAVYGYHAYNYYECGGSMYIHRPDPSLSTAENLLKMLRPDQKYTDLEAHVLDIALLLHMEHGGGNNSTFTTRVVTSSGSDTYSVIAAALSSLKGPKHGGANIKVMKMMDDIRAHVTDPLDEEDRAADRWAEPFTARCRTASPPRPTPPHWRARADRSKLQAATRPAMTRFCAFWPGPACRSAGPETACGWPVTPPCRCGAGRTCGPTPGPPLPPTLRRWPPPCC